MTFSLPDRQIRVFSFLSGKMTRKYDESLAAIQEMQQAGTAIYKVEDMEFGRRLAVERELELPGADDRIPGMWINAVWDESGSFVIYPTLLGIKGECEVTVCIFTVLTPCAVVNTVTNRVVRLLGKDETVRFVHLTLYQGAPAKKGLTTAVSTIVSVRLSAAHRELSGRSCVCEPFASRESRTRSNSGVYGVQTPAVLHVYPLGA